MEQGQLAPGGLNFDCKVRRESVALEDMFISHIGRLVFRFLLLIVQSLKFHLLLLAGAMDTFARGLRSAARIVEDGILNGCVKVHSYSAESVKNWWVGGVYIDELGNIPRF